MSDNTMIENYMTQLKILNRDISVDRSLQSFEISLFMSVPCVALQHCTIDFILAEIFCYGDKCSEFSKPTYRLSKLNLLFPIHHLKSFQVSASFLASFLGTEKVDR